MMESDLGRVELPFEDLLHPLEDNNVASIASISAPAFSDWKDLWLPILNDKTDQSVGNILISYRIEFVDNYEF